MTKAKKFLVLPNLELATGGPSTFYRRIVEYFCNHYYYTASNSFRRDLDFILVINGTKRLDILLLAYISKVNISTRLGSIHRSNYHSDPSIIASLVYGARLLLMLASIFTSKSIVFQSTHVKNQWLQSSLGFIFVNKSLVTIYNPSLGIISSNSNFDESSPKLINLISIEANQPPISQSFPFYILKSLEHLGYSVTLHVFGQVHKTWISKQSKSVIISGFLPFREIVNHISHMSNPVYTVADNFTAGCPNSLIESQSLSIPAICLEHTPASELISSFKSGIVLPCRSEHIRNCTFPTDLSILDELMSILMSNYPHFSSNTHNLVQSLHPESVFSEYKNVLASQ